eukprot:5332477-Pyramimonas_sp.AAC.1
MNGRRAFTSRNPSPQIAFGTINLYFDALAGSSAGSGSGVGGSSRCALFAAFAARASASC